MKTVDLVAVGVNSFPEERFGYGVQYPSPRWSQSLACALLLSDETHLKQKERRCIQGNVNCVNLATSVKFYKIRFSWKCVHKSGVFKRLSKWGIHSDLEHKIRCSFVRGTSEVHNNRVHQSKSLKLCFLHLGELFAVDLFLNAGANALFANFELTEEVGHLLHREVIQVTIAGNSDLNWKQKVDNVLEWLQNLTKWDKSKTQPFPNIQKNVHCLDLLKFTSEYSMLADSTSSSSKEDDELPAKIQSTQCHSWVGRVHWGQSARDESPPRKVVHKHAYLVLWPCGQTRIWNPVLDFWLLWCLWTKLLGCIICCCGCIIGTIM